MTAVARKLKLAAGSASIMETCAAAFIAGAWTYSCCLVLAGWWLAKRKHYWFCFVVACLACAEECDQHAEHHEHCRLCAEVCRRCKNACDDLLATIG